MERRITGDSRQVGSSVIIIRIFTFLSLLVVACSSFKLSESALVSEVRYQQRSEQKEWLLFVIS